MSHPNRELLEKAVNTIRFLAADGVQQANSGHPGMPMGAADMAHVLWTRHLRFDPREPRWSGRDRFILSAGHGSMLLYSLLHLAGFDCTLDDLMRANRYLTLLFSRKQGDGRGEEQNDRHLFFPDDVFREYQRLVKTLMREDRIFISDRKLVKLYKLFRVRAWLFSGGTVSLDDLRLLAYLGETVQEIEHLREKVPTLLGDA